MTTPPNTQPDAAQIAREIRAGLEGVTLEDWQPMTVDPDRVAILLNAFDAQAREIAELREALEPFAKAESHKNAAYPDDFTITEASRTKIRIGDLRRARSALRADLRRAREALRAKENPNG